MTLGRKRSAPPLPSVFLCAFLWTVALSACAPPQALEAWGLLEDLAAGPGPSRLKETTPEPRREAIVYSHEGRSFSGDLYRSTQGAAAPLVLVPGAARDGKDDPRLIAIAKTLARSRFTVLVPDIANLRQLKVTAADAREIAAAVEQVAAVTGGRDQLSVGPSVGIVAISYAVGPAFIAALEPPARDRVRFLAAIGGYYDLEAVIAFFTTGHYRDGPEAPWRTRPPNAFGKWVFVRNNADRLDDPADRVLLTAMAARKLDNLASDVGDLVPRLGPEGRAVYALLANRDPERVPALIAGLPAAVRDEIAALDLKTRDLAALQAEVILVHGRDDPIIPETESQALERALPAGKAHLYLVDALAHADLKAGSTGDALVLLPAAYRLLGLRNAVLEPLDESLFADE